ncbi:hypothetical protein KC19_8G186100 [Ceratodon purpureus]|uniref:Secreted protein n=1 Tax=Ceratodon purpureus TaxID=3225 RepID=A0A8T0H4P6_CERPU|nr:hypothetical protein KC19_8G186100 [Ceratodon purpureus]
MCLRCGLFTWIEFLGFLGLADRGCSLSEERCLITDDPASRVHLHCFLSNHPHSPHFQQVSVNWSGMLCGMLACGVQEKLEIIPALGS